MGRGTIMSNKSIYFTDAVYKQLDFNANAVRLSRSEFVQLAVTHLSAMTTEDLLSTLHAAKKTKALLDIDEDRLKDEVRRNMA